LGKYPPECEKRNGTNLDDLMEPYMTYDILLLFTLQVTIVHGDGFKKLSEEHDVFSGDTVKCFFFLDTD
jgi:hypothetical protein